jgi:hypothetical protein
MSIGGRRIFDNLKKSYKGNKGSSESSSFSFTFQERKDITDSNGALDISDELTFFSAQQFHFDLGNSSS